MARPPVSAPSKRWRILTNINHFQSIESTKSAASYVSSECGTAGRTRAAVQCTHRPQGRPPNLSIGASAALRPSLALRPAGRVPPSPYGGGPHPLAAAAGGRPGRPPPAGLGQIRPHNLFEIALKQPRRRAPPRPHRHPLAAADPDGRPVCVQYDAGTLVATARARPGRETVSHRK